MPWTSFQAAGLDEIDASRRQRSLLMFIFHDIVDVLALVGAVRIGRGVWRRWHKITP
jgi:hypothetical protein